MVDQDLKKKYVETAGQGVVADVARVTGVDHRSVEKVLKHLGLETALANRLELHYGVRIAAGQVSE